MLGQFFGERSVTSPVRGLLLAISVATGLTAIGGAVPGFAQSAEFGAWAEAQAATATTSADDVNPKRASEFDGTGGITCDNRSASVGPSATAMVCRNENGWSLAGTTSSFGPDGDAEGQAQFYDTYKVEPGSSGLHAGSRVPIVLHVKGSGRVANSPWAEFELDTRFRTAADSGSVPNQNLFYIHTDSSVAYDKDFSVGALAVGDSAMLDPFIFVQASTQAPNPSAALSLQVTVCSTTPGIMITSASGASCITPVSTPPAIVPTIAPPPNSAGWDNGPVTVTWTVTDSESPIASTDGCDPVTLTGETAGTTLTCTATNSAGLSSSASTTVRIDETPPTVVVTQKPSPNAAGWNNTDVTVSFQCSDALSGVAICPKAVTLTQEGRSQVVTGLAVDNADNATLASVSINIDKAPPTVVASRAPAANQYGWNNGGVAVSFQCGDSLSGIASCPAPVAVSSDGANQSVTGTATDVAGNSASATLSGINIDSTPPTVTYTGNAGSYTIDQQVQISCTPQDNLSGVLSSTCSDISGPAYSFAPGTNTFSASATDYALNVGTGSTTFTVVVTPAGLSNLVTSFESQPGIANSMIVKLNAGAINAFINEVEAQSNKSLTADRAAILIRLATAL